MDNKLLVYVREDVVEAMLDAVKREIARRSCEDDDDAMFTLLVKGGAELIRVLEEAEAKRKEVDF